MKLPNKREAGSYRELSAQAVVNTIEILGRRIYERFPNSGLGEVCKELLQVAHETNNRSNWIARPSYIIRSVVYLTIGIALAALIYSIQGMDMRIRDMDLFTFIQVSEAAVNTIVLVGAAIISLITIENRIKRGRALQSLHELRALAHVIDMHQLTKDPSVVLGNSTESSPKRTLSAFQITRYLDYCSEMLSLTGKVAAMYAQRFSDPEVANAVNDIELLTTGLSRKIWQKLMVVRGNVLPEKIQSGE